MGENREEIKQNIESGQYYVDALQWYNTKYHAPISQRAMLIIITGCAVAIILMSLTGLFILMPLNETRPMIVRVPDSLERVATVEALQESADDDPDTVVLDWFVRDFVEKREAYDVDKQQRFFRRVYVLGTQRVFDEYIALYRGANSPTARYERHTKRLIDIRDVDIRDVRESDVRDSEGGHAMEARAIVEFEATEAAPTENRKSLWRAEITFRFTKIHVDQITGDISEMKFNVTDYKSKQLGLE